MSSHKTSAKDLFLQAVENHSPDEWSTFLDTACGSDAKLRQRVQLLLDAHGQANRLLDATGPVATVALPAAKEQIGTSIGPYKLLQEIGEGGFGVVYMAEQSEPVNRKVALKVVKPGMDTREVVARFEAERQALAMMDHPNIAHVLDAGATDAGRPFFVMELVKGVPITQYADKNNLSTHERLELFVAVCRAIQHAHQKGVIHRDIKPSNVMVTLHDGQPVAKVIDFGVSKALNQKLTEKTLFTAYGQMVGTPQYMSPEQAEMSGLDIDTRSDIYSLGILLYELLTGTTPLESKQLREASYAEMQRMIQQEEPPRPSTRLSTLGDKLTVVAKHRNTDPNQLQRAIHGELDWIVMKSLEKERGRRYESASSFAADVQRYLSNEAVQACSPSTAYKVRKFVRRNRGPVIAAAALMTVLCLGLAGTSLGLIWANRERADAIVARDDQAKARRDADRRRNEADQQRSRAEESESEGRRRLVRLTIANGMRHLDDGDLLSSLPWFAEALRLDHKDVARTELHRLRIGSALAHCPKLVWMWHHEGPVTHETGTLYLLLTTNAEFCPDGRYVVAPSGNRSARVWDTTTGEVVHVMKHDFPVRHACFSHDGRMIATSSGDVATHKGIAAVWDSETGQQIMRIEHNDAVIRTAFGPHGNRLATGAWDGSARVWNIPTGDPITPPLMHDARVIAVSFSPDGRCVITSGQSATARIWDAVSGESLSPSIDGERHASFSPDGSLAVTGGELTRVWETSTGKLLTTLPQHSWHASFSPVGKWLVIASGDKTAQVWDVATGRRVSAPMRHPSGVAHAEFSPDGRYVVTGAWNRTARVWEAATGDPVSLPLKHGGDVMHASFSPDGRRIVTASTDLMVRVWDLANLTRISRSIRHSDRQGSARFSASFGAGGRRIVTASDADRSARVWDVDTLEPVTAALEHSDGVGHAVLSHDGRNVLTISNDRTARLWDTTSGRPKGPPLNHDAPVLHGSFSPSDDRVVTACGDGAVRVWNVHSGEQITAFQHNWGVNVNVASFHPDGDRVLTASDDGTAQIWDATTAKPLTTPLQHKSAVLFACFSTDGRRVLTTSFDGTARVWNAQTGEPISPRLWHGQAIIHGAFSPDGQRVATASNDNTVRVWDFESGKLLTPPLGWEPGNPHCVSFSHDGRLVATAWGTGFARVWDAFTGEPITGRLRHSYTYVDNVEFSPDDRRLLTASQDGTARLWDMLPDDRPIEDLALLAQVLCGHRIDDTGGSLVPVDADSLRDAWLTLREKYPADFNASPDDLFHWHREEALAHERIQEWNNAVKHLEAARQYTTEPSILAKVRDDLARLHRLLAEDE